MVRTPMDGSVARSRIRPARFDERESSPPRLGCRILRSHVVPRSRLPRRADAHCWDNVVLACRPCNGKKGDRTLAELGWTLDHTPVALTRRQWLIVGYADVEPVWAPYLATV